MEILEQLNTVTIVAVAIICIVCIAVSGGLMRLMYPSVILEGIVLVGLCATLVGIALIHGEVNTGYKATYNLIGELQYLEENREEYVRKFAEMLSQYHGTEEYIITGQSEIMEYTLKYNSAKENYEKAWEYTKWFEDIYDRDELFNEMTGLEYTENQGGLDDMLLEVDNAILERLD